ncbi:MAG: ABC transporter ATP-binding protein [Ruminococcus sp.]|nr:ABC transporter ATP-binding protein [Ruminococcus sp.]
MENYIEALLTVRGLCKTYGEGDSRVTALDDISLDIERSKLVAVLGNSGSGKSTLLNMLGGMDRFDSGSVRFNGVELGEMNDRELTSFRRNTVGFVFQSFNLIAGLTAKENVMLTADKKNPEAAEQALRLVGLDDKTDRYPAELSGGQQQRVSIARAFAKDPELFLCDEPTGALDSETGRIVLENLEKLVRDHKKTMIIVTHNEQIAKIADRIIRMKNGKIISNEETPAVMSVNEIEW